MVFPRLQPRPSRPRVLRLKGQSKAQSTVKESPKVQALRAGWMAKKTEIFAGKYQKPDVRRPGHR